MTSTTISTGPVFGASRHVAAVSSSFVRLVGVEARKLVDTRAGFWLMVTAVLLTALVSVGSTAAMLLWAPEGSGPVVTWFFATSAAGFVLGLLLSILGVLTVTNEWTQRTALVTFALEPRRGRVLLAKAVVLALATVLILLFSLAVGAAIVGVVQALGFQASWAMPLTSLAGFAAVAVLDTALGVAFGLLLLHGVGGIVAIFVVPMVWQVVVGLGQAWQPLADAAPWLVPSPSVMALQMGTITGVQWGHLATSLALWLLLPAAIGTWRWLRRQVA